MSTLIKEVVGVVGDDWNPEPLRELLKSYNLDEFLDEKNGIVTVPFSKAQDSRVADGIIRFCKENNAVLAVNILGCYTDDTYCLVPELFDFIDGKMFIKPDWLGANDPWNVEIAEHHWETLRRVLLKNGLPVVNSIPLENYAKSKKLQKVLDKVLIELSKKENSYAGEYLCLSVYKGRLVFGVFDDEPFIRFPIE